MTKAQRIADLLARLTLRLRTMTVRELEQYAADLDNSEPSS